MTEFSRTRSLFHIPPDMIYLDGHSLGPLPASARDRVAAAVSDQWGEMLITAWNRAGWMDAPTRIGDRIGRLIGAQAGTVVVGETLTIRLFQALAAALSLRPDRKVILTDRGNFPSDLYAAQGLIAALGQGHVLRIVSPQKVADAIDDDVAALMLTEVDFATARRHDMADLTAAAHRVGALTVWDLAHSAGAVAVDVTAANSDFAVGCTYKYLNGGPGAPAFIQVRPDLQNLVRPTLAGWLGHARPFDFLPDYEPAPGISRMRVGTPAVIQMASLDAALDAYEGISMVELEAGANRLIDRFLDGIGREVPELEIASPKTPPRGSHVALRHPQGYAIMQALIDRGVVGDFRAPDIMRFAITPLYIGEDDLDRAIEVLGDIMRTRAWDNPSYRRRNPVT